MAKMGPRNVLEAQGIVTIAIMSVACSMLDLFIVKYVHCYRKLSTISIPQLLNLIE